MKPRSVLVFSAEDGPSYSRLVTAELQLRQILRLRLHGGAFLRAQRNQAGIREVAELARRRIADEFRDVLTDAGDHRDVRLLHVEEQRPRDRVRALGDRIELSATPTLDP